MPKAAAIPARKIRKALGPELVDVVVGMERAIDDTVLPGLQTLRGSHLALDADISTLHTRLNAIEAAPVLPVGLTFLARLRWLVTGAAQ